MVFVHPRLEQVGGGVDAAHVPEVGVGQTTGVDGLQVIALDEDRRCDRLADDGAAHVAGEREDGVRAVGDECGRDHKAAGPGGLELQRLVLGPGHGGRVVDPVAVECGDDAAQPRTGLGGGEPALGPGHGGGQGEGVGSAVVDGADVGEVDGAVGGGEPAGPPLPGVDTPGKGEVLRELGGIHTEHPRATVREGRHHAVSRPVVARGDHENGGHGHQSFGPSSSGGGLPGSPSGTVGVCVCMNGSGPSYRPMEICDSWS